MKRFLTLTLTLLTLATPAMSNTLEDLTKSVPPTPRGFPSMAEVNGLESCGFTDIKYGDKDSSHIFSNDIAELSWAAELATSYGTDFSRISVHQLMMVRMLNSRVANKAGTMEYLSVHEALVSCELGYILLDKPVVNTRGRE